MNPPNDPSPPIDYEPRSESMIKKLGPVAWLGLIASTLPPLGSILLLAKIQAVSGWLRESGSTGLMTYIIGFWVLTGLAILPTYATAVLGGWAFGPIVGLSCAMIGFIGASAIAYFIGRRASGDRVNQLLRDKPRWGAIARALFGSGTGKTLLIVTILRLPPNSPFALTNLALSSLGVPFPIYLVGTFLGMLPRTAAVVYAASHMQQLTLEQAPDWRWFAAGIAITIGVLAILWFIARSALRRMTAESEA